MKKRRIDRNIYQVTGPRKDRCCICGKRELQDPPIERRPTGHMGTIQEWAFCPSCHVKHLEVTNQYLESFEAIRRDASRAYVYAAGRRTIPTFSHYVTTPPDKRGSRKRPFPVLQFR